MAKNNKKETSLILACPKALADLESIGKELREDFYLAMFHPDKLEEKWAKEEEEKIRQYEEAAKRKKIKPKFSKGDVIHELTTWPVMCDILITDVDTKLQIYHVQRHDNNAVLSPILFSGQGWYKRVSKAKK